MIMKKTFNIQKNIRILLVLSVILNIILVAVPSFYVGRKLYIANKYQVSEKVLSTFNNTPLQVNNGRHDIGADNTISIVFLGNSLTYCSVPKEEDDKTPRGLTSTAIEKDYVHRLIKMISESYHVNVQYSISNIARLERGFAHYNFDLDSCFSLVEIAEPDMLILQMGENVSRNDAASYPKELKEMFAKLLTYYPQCKKYVTLPWWIRPDENYIITEVATESKASIVDLSHLGSDPEHNHASIQKYYEQPGVGTHPGDEGMSNIAKCLFTVIQNSYSFKD